MQNRFVLNINYQNDNSHNNIPWVRIIKQLVCVYCILIDSVLQSYGESSLKMKISSAEHKISIFLHTMEVNGYRQLFGYKHSSKYLLLHPAAEINSYRFGTN